MTILFLESLKKYADPSEIEVIVVDNGSKEDCSEVLKQTYPSVIYVRSLENLGFAGGNNLGITYASGEYLLFLNNDTEITNHMVRDLRQELDNHPDIGLLSPLILFFDDKSRIQYAGYTPMNYLTCRNEGIGYMDADNGQYDQTTRQTGYCHGAGMMCRRQDLAQVGLMDESYFLYYEELDWCEKFTQAGKLIGFTGKAKLYHKESMSVGKASPLKTYFMTRNRWLFIRRNTGVLNIVLFSIYFLMVVTPRLVIPFLFQRRLDLVKAAWKGIRWNISHKAASTNLGYKFPAS